MSDWKITTKHTQFLLVVLYVIAYFIPLTNRMLWIPDESRYAEISREMIQRGDWIVPHLLGLHYFEKPIAGYWLNSISQLLFGETHFAVRIASALSAGLTAFIIYRFTHWAFQCHKKATAVAICYLSFILVYAVGTYSVLDSMVTLWLDLTLVCFYVSLHTQDHRKKWIGYASMGIAAGMGFLTKGFIALAIPVIVALPYLIYRKQLFELRYLWIAFLSLLLVSLPWVIAIQLKAPDYWHYFFWVEHVQRFTSEKAQHKAPFWYYIPILLGGCLPWVGLAPTAIKQMWQTTQQRALIVFLGFWSLIPFVFFSLSKGKLPTYILPCFAPIAILLGCGIVELLQNNCWQAIRTNAWINLVFGLLATAYIILSSTWLVGKRPLYQAQDQTALMFATLCFLGWTCAGWLSLRYPDKSLPITALAPMTLGLCIGWALPSSLVHSKQPEVFIAQHIAELQHSRFVFSDDIGLAVSLGWQLKRDDIQLYESSGELAYGLTASPIPGKLLEPEEFSRWLPEARKQGNVALLSRTTTLELPKDIPPADEVIRQNHLILFYYRQINQQTSRSITND